MDRLDRDLVRARLARLGQPPPCDEPGARAAVAVVLGEARTCPSKLVEVLLIRRAEDPRDPWSGHMAFPGGRQDPGDPDLIETAIRETREEVGLDLRAHAEPIGCLPQLPAIARGRKVGLVIAPHVFALHADVPLSPNHEVAEVVWTDLLPLIRGESRATMPYVYQGQRLELPGHKVGERIVWGLTFQMLEGFFDVLRSESTASTRR